MAAENEPKTTTTTEPDVQRLADLRAELAAERVSKRDIEGKFTGLQAEFDKFKTDQAAELETKLSTEVGKVTTKLTKMQQRVVEAEIKAKGAELNIADPDLLLHPLLERAGIKVDDEGTVSGVAEAFEALKAKKPEWFKVASTTTTEKKTGAASPVVVTTAATTDARKMSPEEYKAHRDNVRKNLRLAG